MKEISKKRKIEECKKCNRNSWYVSRNGLCRKCLTATILNANTQIRLKQGLIYEKYKKGVLKKLGVEE